MPSGFGTRKEYNDCMISYEQKGRQEINATIRQSLRGKWTKDIHLLETSTCYYLALHGAEALREYVKNTDLTKK